MEEPREFRGYMNGKLLCTFPLDWLDNIKIKDGAMIVSYYAVMQYNAEIEDQPLVEIRVDEIDVK